MASVSTRGSVNDKRLGTGRLIKGLSPAPVQACPGQDRNQLPTLTQAEHLHGPSALDCRPYHGPLSQVKSGLSGRALCYAAVGGAIPVYLPLFRSSLPWVGGSATVLRTCCNGPLHLQDRSCWTHWRRPGISSSVMCYQPCRPSSTLCRCVLAGCVGVRGPWGHRMALVGRRTPALMTPSVLTQAVPYRPAEPSV